MVSSSSSSNKKLRRSSVDKPQQYPARLDPDVYNAAAAYSNSTHASINTFLNAAISHYVSSGQASVDFPVSPLTEQTHGDELRAAIDKLSGE